MIRPDRVTLTVEGVDYFGWKSVRIQRGIEAVAGSFELEVSERWGADLAPWPIQPGDRCQVSIGDEPVVTGYVDDDDPGYDGSSHAVRVAGRDKTADLVDCSIMERPAQWSNIGLEDLARRLCAPFGIEVVAGDDTGGPIAEAAAQEGDSPHDVLDKLCKSRNVWPTTDGLGRLKFVRASRERLETAIERPGLIKAASAKRSHKARFSHWLGKGQRNGSDDTAPADHCHANAELRDEAVRRYRPKIVLGEDQANGLSLADRIANARNASIGEGLSVTVEVPGWRMPNGALWPVNRLVPIHDAWLKVSEDLLIVEAVYSIDGSGGTRTQLTLKPPGAFDIKQAPPKGAAGETPGGADPLTMRDFQRAPVTVV